MNKYIIRNCPAYIHRPLSTHDRVCLLGDKVKPNHKELYVYCKDCTDCVLKQIVDVLRENTCKPEECGMNKPDWNGEVYGCNAGFDDNVSGCSCALANNLLRKLDIQECE